MNRVTIMCSKGPIELSEFVEELYAISEKANRALKELRTGLPTWIEKETYNKMQISLWIYDNIEVNAFCHYENGQNYIALSVGLLTMLWREAEEFVDQDNLALVFKISEENKKHFKDTLFFFMVNFTIAHEYGHIAHGHLKDYACENNIDERFSAMENISDEEKKMRNWNIQLREYDADSFAVAVQSMLFLQQWQDNIKVNLANFDVMFIANYLCFRTFAENMGRDFSNYMTKDIDEYDHPHPGIRMYYSSIHYSYWLIKLHGESEEVLTILESGSHAVVAYEKQVLETNELRECYYSIAYTAKGVQHLMSLHNGWQELVDCYNQYAYIPIEKMECIDSMLTSLDESGSFIESYIEVRAL